MSVWTETTKIEAIRYLQIRLLFPAWGNFIRHLMLTLSSHLCLSFSCNFYSCEFQLMTHITEGLSRAISECTKQKHECFDKAVYFSIQHNSGLVSTQAWLMAIMLPFAKIDHLAQVSALYWLMKRSVLLVVSRWVPWETRMASETEWWWQQGGQWRLIVVLNYTYENAI